MFVFVYSSYHLKLSFPHLVAILTTLGIRGHYHESSDCFEYPQKSLLKSSHPEKYLPNFPTQKIPGSKISNPKKSFDHPRHLKSGPPGLYGWFLAEFFLIERLSIICGYLEQIAISCMELIKIFYALEFYTSVNSQTWQKPTSVTRKRRQETIYMIMRNLLSSKLGKLVKPGSHMPLTYLRWPAL